MKFENEIKFKEIPEVDRMATVVDSVVNFIFSIDSNGKAIYAPYYYEYAVKFAIIAHLIDGIELEDEDVGESLVDIAMKNEAVADLVDMYIGDNDADIFTYVDEIVQFKQKEYLHKNDELNAALLKAVNLEAAVSEAALELAKRQQKIASQQIKMNEQNEEILAKMSPDDVAALNTRLANGELDIEQLANIVIEKYLATDKHDEAMREVIDEKNKKIIELTQKG